MGIYLRYLLLGKMRYFETSVSIHFLYSFRPLIHKKKTQKKLAYEQSAKPVSFSKLSMHTKHKFSIKMILGKYNAIQYKSLILSNLLIT